jgi:kynurenine 3-monooxygenase
MLIALPNIDGSFTCTLFFPHEGNPSFEQLKTKDDVLTFFKEVFPDAVPLMPTLTDDFFKNPTSSLCIIKCKPWIYQDKLALIGDAAHAIVPFYGQGMNCGFEDVYVLDDLIEKHKHDWMSILKEYQELRKPDGDAIAQLAKDNFKEMSEKTADPKFILRKKIEAKFAELHPDKWTTLYSMVTFSPHIRYSEAYKRGLEQDVIMDKIMTIPDIENKWDSNEVMQEMEALVNKTTQLVS